MDPPTLQTVLSSRECPTLLPAHLHGYHIKMWGRYPALVDGRALPKVPGMVFTVSEFQHIRDVGGLLQHYEGPNYSPVQVLVELVGQEGTLVNAMTFKWTGDEKELTEGSFDLKDYQMRRFETRRCQQRWQTVNEQQQRQNKKVESNVDLNSSFQLPSLDQSKPSSGLRRLIMMMRKSPSSLFPFPLKKSRPHP